MATTSLVLELQHMASDHAIPVSALLLKAKMVAVKLGLRDKVAYLDREINGYEGGKVAVADLPAYRWSHGSLKFENPYHGLRPITFRHRDAETAMTRAFVGNSVRELEDVISDPKSVFVMPLDDVRRRNVEKNADVMGMPVHNVFTSTQLQGILMSIRAAILDWSLALEADGILGEGLTFTHREKQVAQHTTNNFNFNGSGPINGVVGPVDRSTVRQNIDQSLVTNDVAALLAAIRNAGVPEEAVEELEAAVAAEPQATNGQVGPRVGAWIGSVAQKVVTGVWGAAQAKTIELVVAAVNAHYGI